MSKYEKVTLSFATSTAEDQYYIAKFSLVGKGSKNLLKKISEDWIDMSDFADARWHDGKWHLVKDGNPYRLMINLNLVTDIHIETVEVEE